jgi:hypothetical protein
MEIGHDDYNCECGLMPKGRMRAFLECDLHHRVDCPTCA